MTSKLFELKSVIPRVDLEPGEKIETLEYSIGSLFIGTSIGNLIQYGIAERTDQSGLKVFSASLIATKTVTANAKVTFLYAAPAINRLLVLCDSTLFIMNMSDLSVLPMAGSNKLKGVSAVCVNNNPTLNNPFSVEVCVAKRKQCQLAVLHLTEDKLSVSRTRECSHPVLAMSMDGVNICAALTTKYIVYNMETMSEMELFPLDINTQVQPTITRVDKEEFLVLGPGNLGMFVKASGIAGRPPIQWSSHFSNLVYKDPHIIGQGSETVAVYNINDQEFKQGMSYSGGRFIGFFDGIIFLASSNSIESVSSVPWEEQANSLLAVGHIDEAVRLANDSDTGNTVKIKAGFIYLNEGNFSKAEELLLSGKVDPREVISLFPGMLPATSKFVRSNPPLHSIPNINSIKKTEISPFNFLASYLQSLTCQERNSLACCSEVYTALIKVCCEVNTQDVVNILKDEKNIVLDEEELSEFFLGKSLHHFRAVMFWERKELTLALKIWSRIVSNELQDSSFPGLEFFMNKLSQCTDELVYEYCDLILQLDAKLGAKLFTKHQIDFHTNQQFIDNSLNILSKYPEARTSFLEYLIVEKNSEIENHHTQLAMALISSVKNVSEETMLSILSKRLSRHILTSRYLNAQYLLQHLKDTKLDYEKAILHGKLGDHERALEILVNNVGNYAMAENYCDDLSVEKNENRSQLLLKLLSIYLSSNTKINEFTALAVDLINKRAEDFDGIKVISMLPDTWNISIILPALKVFSRNLLHSKRMTMVSKSLHKSVNIQTHNKLINVSKEPVFINPQNYCVVCQKTFSSEGIARYPNGVILHANCVKNAQVCPLTGDVFKIKV